MVIGDLLVAFVFGFFVVWVVSIFFGTKGPWDSFLWFFLVVGLFAWAGGVWLVPFGPRWMGIGWFPIFFMGILAVLLITSASPRKTIKAVTPPQETAITKDSRIAIDIIFWLLILIVCLLILGSSHYFWYPRVS
jgi:hypothetical protein